MFPRWLTAVCVWLILVTGVRAQETLPPAPERHFNDYAGVVSANDAQQLDQRLVRYERETTNQFVVAIFQKLETQSSLEDYTRRVMNAWKVGQAGKNNGVVLFVFIKDRKMRFQVGPGLTGALPDTFCKRILDDKLTPAFRGGDYAQGLHAAIDTMIHATEPKAASPAPAGTPAARTAVGPPSRNDVPFQEPAPEPRPTPVRTSSPSILGPLTGGFFCFFPLIIFGVVVAFIATLTGKSGRGPYSRNDPSDSFRHSGFGGGSSGDSGGFSSGGSSDSGFSGGGGSSDGGGGASGSW